MDKLKQFIEEHAGEFQEEALPEGHLERFEKKLPAFRSNKRRLIIGLCALTTAATFALLIWVKPILMLNETEDMTCGSANEISEVRLYYQMQMDEVIAQMQTIYKERKAPGTADLLKETSKVLSENEAFETKVLPRLPCTDQGLYAMNQHYSNSLESLTIMLQQMERVTNEYENRKE